MARSTDDMARFKAWYIGLEWRQYGDLLRHAQKGSLFRLL